MLAQILQAVQILSAVLLIVLVMLHSPKGDGLGGIGGAAQLFSSQKGAEDTLNKVTMWVAVSFFAISFVLGYFIH